jgi:hypothetical protein
MKRIFISLLVLPTLVILNTSTHKSIWPNCDYITKEGKANCIQFKYLKGSNRTAEFKKIIIETFEKPSVENNKVYSSSKFSLCDLRKMLGEPDVMISETKFGYNLNPNVPNSVVNFDFNKSTNTFQFVAKNCD